MLYSAGLRWFLIFQALLYHKDNLFIFLFSAPENTVDGAFGECILTSFLQRWKKPIKVDPMATELSVHSVVFEMFILLKLFKVDCWFYPTKDIYFLFKYRFVSSFFNYISGFLLTLFPPYLFCYISPSFFIQRGDNSLFV